MGSWALAVDPFRNLIIIVNVNVPCIIDSTSRYRCTRTILCMHVQLYANEDSVRAAEFRPLYTAASLDTGQARRRRLRGLRARHRAARTGMANLARGTRPPRAGPRPRQPGAPYPGVGLESKPGLPSSSGHGRSSCRQRAGTASLEARAAYPTAKVRRAWRCRRSSRSCTPATPPARCR